MSELKIVERGCGWPVEDSMYWLIGMGEDGIPAEEFLMDPLKMIPSDITIKNRGLTLIRVGDTYHVVDHVGSGPYPNAADWFEEVKRFGFHQKIDRNLDFSKLDMAKSRYFLVHDRVIPVTFRLSSVYDDLNFLGLFCKRGIEKHDNAWTEKDYDAELLQNCCTLLWTDLLKAEVTESLSENVSAVHRQMPSFSYTGYSMKEKELSWLPGFFASFPIAMMQSIMYPGSNEEVTEEIVQEIHDSGWANDITFVSVQKKA